MVNENLTNPYNVLWLQGLISFIAMLFIAWYSNYLNRKNLHSEKQSKNIEEKMKSIESKIDNRVLKINCDGAMERVGNQIKDIEFEQKNISNTINKHSVALKGIEVGMSFLVKQYGVDYTQLKTDVE